MLIDVFERIKDHVIRLEKYTEVPSTVAMKVVVVKILAEVLGIFAALTKEMKQARWSESVTGHTFPVADKHLEKFPKKLIGRRDVEDALSRLYRLTKEGIQIAVQLLKDKHGVDHKVIAVSGMVEVVDDKLAVEGT